MQQEYKVLEHSQGELKITIDGDQWQQAQKKAFKKLASKAQIKGFRQGHAPEAMIRSQIGEKEILLEAIDMTANDALLYGVQENKLRLVSRPELINMEQMDEKAVTLVFRVTVYPQVTLGDYKSLEYKVEKVSVKKSEVDDEIKKLQERYAEEVLKVDGAVENGDIAVLDFEGFKDGKPFEGGKGTEYPLTIGSNSFIPGFEEQIIGMTADQEKDINVTFPKDYSVDELAGAPVTFKVKVDSVKQKKLPELNEDFVKEVHLNDNLKTVDDLTAFIKDEMKNQKTSQAEEKATDELLSKLADNCQVEIPEVMIDDETQTTYENYVSRLQGQGISMDMYYKITSQNEEGFKKNLRPDAEKKVRVRLLLEAVADDLKLEPTAEEIEKEYQNMATEYSMDVAKVKELAPQDYIASDLKMRQALDILKKQHEPVTETESK